MTSDSQLKERSVRGLHEALLARLPNDISSSSKILDLGCGSGAWLERLASSGFTDLHGVDADIDQNRSIRATIMQANFDIPDWDSDFGTYDVVTAIEVLEHLENPGQFLTQISRLLKTDGCFLMTTPNVHSLVCRLRYLTLGKLKQFDDKGDPTHIYPVFLENLEKLVQRHGMIIDSVWGYPEDGSSLTSRPLVNLFGRFLNLFLSEKVGGDVFCAVIRKNRQVPT